MHTLICGELTVAYSRYGTLNSAMPPVVLLHGNWASRQWWEPMAAALMPLLPGATLLAPDLCGRGDTRGVCNGYLIPDLATDLALLLDGLGHPRAHIVGHSLGSAVAMEFALRWPDRVMSLVAVGPAWVDGMPPALGSNNHRHLHEDRQRLDEALRLMSPNVIRDARWEALVDIAHTQHTDATAGALRGLQDWQPGSALGQLTVPRVVIHGEIDPLCGGPTAIRAAEAMRCEHICVPGVGHSPNIEAPAKVAKIVESTIRRAPTAPL